MDEQVELLRAIWNEMKALNGRVETTNAVLRTDLKNEVGALRSDLNEGMGGLRSDLRSEVGDLRAEVHVEMEGSRAAFHSEMGDLRAELHVELETSRATLQAEMGDFGLGTALGEFSLDVRELTDIVQSWRDEHSIDREDLRERLSRLERRVGLDPP